MKNTKIISLLCALTLTSACVPALIVGTGAAAGKTATQEKSIGNSIDDTSTWTRIKAAIANHENTKDLLLKVSVKVLEGRVLLTGVVPTPEDRMNITKLTWEQKGVKEVINEINVEDGSKVGLIDMTKDTWITTKIKSKLLVHKEVKSINYTIETNNRIVYLMGIAADENELDIVTHVAGTISGVEKVVSYVRIKNSEIRKQMLNNQF